MHTKNAHISELNYNTLGTDFKVEAVAKNLLKYYDQYSNIFIKRIGINDRPYLKDIKTVYSNYYGLDEETVIIESFRESIYDYLPEGLFHPPSLGDFNKSVENVVREIRKQKEVEENARNFFQPFELEFFYTEISALLKETEFDVADKSEGLITILSELWPLLKRLDANTARTFIFLLPFLHEVRGKKEWIERFFTAFLKIDVKIGFVQNSIDEKDDLEGITTLGNTRLGITFIPNGKHLDGERNWQINFGPIPYEDINKYVSGHPFRDLINTVYDYFIPISVKVFENFVTEKSPDSFVLNTAGNTNRLGYSTFI